MHSSSKTTTGRRERSNITNEISSALSTSKKVRREGQEENNNNNNNMNETIFSATVLHNKSDGQLLASLFEFHRILCSANNATFSINSAFITELLSSRYLKSGLTGVQQMTGCLLCDIIRLNGMNTSGDKKKSVLPFDSKYADDILKCLTSPFEEVIKGEGSLKKCEHIIERASISHVFLYIIPYCRKPVQDHLTDIFKSINYTGGVSSGGEFSLNNDNAITTITAAEMGKILVDILNVTKTITPEQLIPLLKEITTASPTLLRRTENNKGIGINNSTPSNNNNNTIDKTSRKKGKSPGAVIAARILLEQVDVIQPAIASYISDMIEQGIGEVISSDITGENIEIKRQGLRSIGRAMEYIVALVELHIDLVGQLIPTLIPYLEHNNSDIRLLFIRGLFMMFVAHESAISVYNVAFNSLMSRFHDPKHALRIEMLQLTAGVIRAAATTNNNNNISTNIIEERIRVFLPFLEQRLIDSHALVRRAAVLAYSDIISHAPLLISSERLEHTLGLRVGDKNLKVRQVAVEQLSGMYQILLYPWIPNVVMRCLNAEGGVSLLESCFELMLPAPSKFLKNESSSFTNSSSSSLGGRRSSTGRTSMALFDFEKQSETKERTFVDGFAKLCSHLNSWSFSRLLTFAAKKAQLRLTILRLFQLRVEVRTKELKSPEGQELINNIHRLLNFLQNMTHAERGEWDVLFRAKDDKVSKAFLNCCADKHVHYAAERESLIKTLKGRVDAPVLKFVQESLSKQMMLPLEVEHVEELISRLREIINEVCNNKNMNISIELKSEVEGLLRALLVFGRTAPSLLPRCAVSVVEFTENICNCSNNENIPPYWILLLLNTLQEWATYACKNTNESDESVSLTIAARKRNLLLTLGKLCSCSHTSFIHNITPEIMGNICKNAARCFVALLAVKGMGEPKALIQLIETLRGRICNNNNTNNNDQNNNSKNKNSKSSKSIIIPHSSFLVGWLKSLTAFAKDPVASPLIQDEILFNGVAEILLNNARDDTEVQDAAKVKSKSIGILPTSNTSAIVDAAAKCLTSIAQSHSPDRAASAISSTLDILLNAYKIISERDAHTVGACRRRLSINQQLCKLVIKPSSDLGKELAVAVIISAEGENVVHRPIQQKITHHITHHNNCDMRYVALLFLTAISEETKHGYQQLRTYIQQVGDYLRNKQITSGATLSSPNALSCYLEYTIPFLVLFMAHHTFYNSEAENHFVSYQRVWHLLFDELFRHGTQCASFVTELFSRIKQSDDVLDKESYNARVLCDLGSRVMQECMGQRQIGAEVLKRYPGRVLIPNFFVSSISATEALSTVYLDEKVHIFSHVPFRAPTTLTNNNNNNNNNNIGMRAGSNIEERAVSTARSTTLGPEDEEYNNNNNNNNNNNYMKSNSAPVILLPLHIQEAIDNELDVIIGTMTKEEIAHLRWSAIKQRIRNITAVQKSIENKKNNVIHTEDDEDNDGGGEEVNESEIMEYAKGQLQIRYERASD